MTRKGVATERKPGTGRKAAGNRGQGHFQDRARQLTSPAFGRAILQGLAWARYLCSPSRQSRCVVRRSGRLARLKRGRAALVAGGTPAPLRRTDQAYRRLV